MLLDLALFTLLALVCSWLFVQIYLLRQLERLFGQQNLTESGAPKAGPDQPGNGGFMTRAPFDAISVSLSRLSERVRKHQAAVETALRNANEQLLALVLAAPVGIVMLDQHGNIRMWNPAAEKIFGWTEAEVLGKPLPNIPPDQAEEHRRNLELLLEGRSFPDWPTRRSCRDGSVREIRISAAPLRDAAGSIVGVMGIMTDITQRIRQLRELELLRKAVENSGEVVFMTDPDGIITWLNPEFTRLYGYSADEVIGKATPRILKSDTQPPETYQRLWQCMMEGKTLHIEFENRTKTGSLVAVEASVNPILDETGAIMGFLAIQRDISERKKIEAKLHESEERYRTMVRTSPDSIIMTALNGTVLFCNDRACELSGYAADADLIGRNVVDLVVPEERPRAREIFQRLVEGESVSSTEFTLLSKSGHRLHGELSASLLRSRDGEPSGFLSIVRDITERKRLEAQFLHAQKMEAVGRLAGGVAHDFNNLLTVILGYSDLLLRESSLDAKTRLDISEIHKAGERASEMTRQLLAFSRKQVMQPKVLDLNLLLQGTETILRRLIGEDIELRLVTDPQLGCIKADPSQIEQILLNLAVNSRDAMPDGGILTIQTANECVDRESSYTGFAVNPGDYVRLSVSDTGIGMGQETLTHIFEPFFTTKEFDKSIGMGMSTVYGIIKQSGGEISVASQPGRGTTVTIHFPRVDSTDRTKEFPRQEDSSYIGRETLLLVEDEKEIRAMMSRALRDCGYGVLEATNGLEALQLFVERPGDIQLLVTDLIMPQLGGKDLAREVLSIRRDIKVLYISGYAEDLVSLPDTAGRSGAVLQKPFTPAALSRKVREILDEPAEN